MLEGQVWPPNKELDLCMFFLIAKYFIKQEKILFKLS